MRYKLGAFAHSKLLAAVALLLILVLAACGQPTPAAAPAEEAAAPAEEAAAEPAQEAAEPAEEAAAEPAEEAAAEEGAADADGLRFAYLTKHLDNPWFVTETEGAKALAEELGVELTVQDLQFDANLALSAMDTVIGTGVDGIIMVVPEQQIGPAVIEKAREANVPLVAVDDEIADAEGNPAPFVGFDASAIGAQVGDIAANLYEESGWMDNPDAVVRAASIELQTLDVCNKRTEAATAQFLSRFPDFGEENVIHVPYDGTLNGGIDAFATTITANPDVTHWILWSCNDDGVLGAVRALENAGVSADNVIGVGLGAHLACDEWAKEEPTGFRSAVYINAALHGQGAVQNLYDHVALGEPLPERTIIEGVEVTPENKGEIEGCEA